ncbi:flagellar hook-basal body complex protein [Stenotrophomonas sp. MYb238]|uniref:flagellar hook-basal body protein n=1 Tax=Stenotrophomonas sp. MYb238 TaxID=2040281 RepID=UPI0012909B60|nr:flagellar hook-basal body complex protein [Stenotrophomonas sp. MYb238]MQP74721.1 flagellar hook-basal body complex protein [Stenotrophomonas sp. MYb238]
MIDALYISSTGLRSQQEQIDVISNNVANMQTPGFKRGRVNFAEVASSPMSGDAQLSGVSHGGGTRVASVSQEFASGAMQPTRGPLDLAIDGNGFFELEDANGNRFYTRSGRFHLDDQGYLAAVNGMRLSAGLQVPQGASDILVSAAGELSALLEGGEERTVLGNVELALFTTTEGLESTGDNLYRAGSRSGGAVMAIAGEGGSGRLQQHYLEAANVDMIDEMTGLVLAQRAYQLNARVLQASDQVLETINNLRR